MTTHRITVAHTVTVPVLVAAVAWLAAIAMGVDTATAVIPCLLLAACTATVLGGIVVVNRRRFPFHDIPDYPPTYYEDHH